MLIPILKSIKEMLDSAVEPTTSVENSKVYVKCAISLIDKVIAINEPLENLLDVVRKNPRLKKVEEEVQYLIDVDASKKLTRISYPGGQELEGDKMIELDGLAMPYSEAVGKQVTKSGRVL